MAVGGVLYRLEVDEDEGVVYKVHPQTEVWSVLEPEEAVDGSCAGGPDNGGATAAAGRTDGIVDEGAGGESGIKKVADGEESTPAKERVTIEKSPPGYDFALLALAALDAGQEAVSIRWRGITVIEFNSITDR